MNDYDPADLPQLMKLHVRGRVAVLHGLARVYLGAHARSTSSPARPSPSPWGRC